MTEEELKEFREKWERAAKAFGPRAEKRKPSQVSEIEEEVPAFTINGDVIEFLQYAQRELPKLFDLAERYLK